MLHLTSTMKPSMINRHIPVVFCAALFLIVRPVISASSGPKPNFILYIADDQAKTDYGVYGNEKVHTPGVDRLAKEGMLFQRAYATQGICAPSRSALYTGNFPLRNGCFLNHTPVREGTMSLVPELQKLGYQVILAGKSHVSPKKAFPWDQHWRPVKADLGQEGGQPERLPIDRIRTFLQNEQTPFCLVIASPLPHGPYPDKPDATLEDVQRLPYHPSPSRNWINKQAGYYENIREDNRQLVAVLESLDTSPHRDNTLFLYTADHGRPGKYTVYEAGVNVPLVIRWAPQIKEDSRSQALVSLIDIFPTLIEAAGGEAPDADGRSFLSVLKGEEQTARNYTYSIAENQNIWMPYVFPARMVTDGRWKYVRNPNALSVHEANFGDNEAVNAFIRIGAEKFPDREPEELFDLNADPFEQQNLATDPAHAETLKRLSAELDRWMREQGDYLADGGKVILFKPRHHPLDKANKMYTPPESLQGTLTPDAYPIP